MPRRHARRSRQVCAAHNTHTVGSNRPLHPRCMLSPLWWPPSAAGGRQPAARIGRCAPWSKWYAQVVRGDGGAAVPSLVVANRMLAIFGSRQPSEDCRAQLNGLTNVARSHMLPRKLPGHLCCQVTCCCRSARCDLATWHVSAQRRAYVEGRKEGRKEY